MIPVFTLSRQHEQLKSEFQQALDHVLTSDRYILGSEVEAFEKEFAEYLGVSFAVGVGNGTDAITLAILALGLHPGDEVIMPANSYPSVFALPAAGVVPKLVDIDPQTYTIDPEHIAAAIGPKTKAIMPVHLYGQAADMEKIMAVADAHGLPVIEDCAQAAGTEIRNIESRIWNIRENDNNKQTLNSKFQIPNSSIKVGGIGKIGCYSFYPTKNIGALGDGGMVVTNDPELYERVKILRMYGEKARYQSVALGRNSRLDELQAAFLRIKLRHLDEWVEKRRKIASKYQTISKNSQLTTHNLQLPYEASYGSHAYHLFVVRSQQRDVLKEYLEKQGVQTGIHYPIPIHLVESFRYLGYTEGDFPESERACKDVLSLPLFPELTDEEVEKIIDSVGGFSK